jgi:hypothetical protein
MDAGPHGQTAGMAPPTPSQASGDTGPAVVSAPPERVPVSGDELHDRPEADVVEQAMPVVPQDGIVQRPPPLEADEYDAAEQDRIVAIDEDEYPT